MGIFVLAEYDLSFAMVQGDGNFFFIIFFKNQALDCCFKGVVIVYFGVL